MYDLVWLLFISGCALAGIALAVLWIRLRKNDDGLYPGPGTDEDVRRGSYGPPGRKGVRPPPPTPDLISVQEAWRREEEEETASPTPIYDLYHGQARGTPTAPSGPRQGWQGALPAHVSGDEAQEAAVDPVDSDTEEPAAD